MAPRPIATSAALALLLGATALQWYWVWGLLFAYWTALGIYQGETFLLVPVRRVAHRWLFWLITAMWGLFAVWYLATPFL